MTRVVVARRPLGRYKPIDDDDIEVRSLDAAGLPTDCITNRDGGRQAHPPSAGFRQCADRRRSGVPPLVKNGDRVRIIAETSGLRISAFGQ